MRVFLGYILLLSPFFCLWYTCIYYIGWYTGNCAFWGSILITASIYGVVMLGLKLLDK